MGSCKNVSLDVVFVPRFKGIHSGELKGADSSFHNMKTKQLRYRNEV